MVEREAAVRYRVVRQLARGGMAEVFEAVLTGGHGFERRVALKCLRSDVGSDPQLATLFLDEARIASALHHAGIVAVLDYGVLDDRPFQALEFVDGLDGAQLIDRARGRARGSGPERRGDGLVPEEVVLVIGVEIARALEYAHHACGADRRPLGIVHRDIKPGNLLLGWQGDVKLTDFGIAFAHDRHHRTEVGTVRGTLGFMAPEQRLGGRVGPAGDVFALGCTLHALATGDSPLSDPAVEHAVLTGTDPPLSPALGEALRGVLGRALRADPARRHASAGALADELGAQLAARLDRDARATIRDYLAPLRDEVVPVRGALDALFDVELVLAGDGDQGRRFTVTRAGTPAEARPEVTREPTAATRSERPPVRGRRIGRRAALALIGLGTATAFGAVWRPWSGSEDTSVGAVAPPDVADAGREADAAPARVPAAGRDAGVPPAAGDGAREDADDREDDAERRSESAERRRPGKRDDERPQRADVAPRASGWIKLAGRDIHRGTVFVDGRKVGSVPDLFELPLGRHRIVVETRDGRRLGPVSIEIEAWHTYTSPLRPAF